MSTLKATGTIHKIGATQQVTDTFSKREFVLKMEDGPYTQLVPFELFQDKCANLDAFKEGDAVDVSFNLKGREWNDKFFVNLNAWKVEKAEGGYNGQ